MEAASRLLTNTQLFYGGGITSIEQARDGTICDTIVVGNIIYDDIKKAIKTVKIKRSLINEFIS